MRHCFFFYLFILDLNLFGIFFNTTSIQGPHFWIHQNSLYLLSIIFSNIRVLCLLLRNKCWLDLINGSRIVDDTLLFKKPRQNMSREAKSGDLCARLMAALFIIKLSEFLLPQTA